VNMSPLNLIKAVAERAGFGTIAAIVFVSSSLAAGAYFKLFTKEVDHPVEQAAEQVLESYGVDIDFSADKKDLDVIVIDENGDAIQDFE
jgi:hypothetical protein